MSNCTCYSQTRMHQPSCPIGAQQRKVQAICDWEKENERYFVKIGEGRWRDVEMDEFVRVERQAGFVNTMGQPDQPGTGGFSDGIRQGRVIHKSFEISGSYDWDPEFSKVAWPNYIAPAHVHAEDGCAGCLACLEPERYDDHTCV